VVRVLRCDPEGVGVDRTVFLARQMIRCVRGQAIDCRDKPKRRMRSLEAMAFHEIFRQQQIANRWYDRCQ
jgi:hypothetical protein